MNTVTLAVASATARQVDRQDRHPLPITSLTYALVSQRDVKPLQMVPESSSKWSDFCNRFGGLNKVSNVLFELVVIDDDGEQHTFQDFRLGPTPIGSPIQGSCLRMQRQRAA